jgi:UDP-2,3-diacylglucosamine pyrophosphatase LpxH
MRYKSVFISDVHLGTDICQHQKLLDFLKSLESKDKKGYNVENLFLVGDIIDMVHMNHKIFWSQHRTVIKKLLRMADKGVTIYFITGNHESYLRDDMHELPDDLNGIQFCDKVVYISVSGKKYLVIHGDQFDGAIRSMPWLYWLGDKAYTVALFCNKWYNKIRKLFGRPYWSLSLWLKSKVKNAVKYIGNYEEIVCKKVKDEGYNGVVCGHIHKADNKYIGDIHYLNSGCFTEFCSVIVEHKNGEMELIYL